MQHCDHSFHAVPLFVFIIIYYYFIFGNFLCFIVVVYVPLFLTIVRLTEDRFQVCLSLYLPGQFATVADISPRCQPKMNVSNSRHNGAQIKWEALHP